MLKKTMARYPVLKYLTLSVAIHLTLGTCLLGILWQARPETPAQGEGPALLINVQLVDFSIPAPQEASSRLLQKGQLNSEVPQPVNFISNSDHHTDHEKQEDQGYTQVGAAQTSTVENHPVLPLKGEYTANLQLSTLEPAESLPSSQVEGLSISRGDPAGAGEGPIPSEAYKRFLTEVRLLLEQARHYPWLARLTKLEGTVTVGFLIDSAGAPHHIRVVTSSNHRILDDAAVLMVKQVAHFPQPPAESSIQLVVPLDFHLSRGQ